MPGFQSRGSQQREDRQGCVVPAPKIIADSAQYSGGRAIALLDAATT
jgi:hypothetical protein